MGVWRDKVEVADVNGAVAATLYLGDAYAVMPALIAAGALQRAETACVTDPPYEFNTSGGGAFRKERPNMDAIEAAGLNRGFDISILDEPSLDGPGGAIADPQAWAASAVVFCHDNQGPAVWAALRARYRRAVACFWHKTNPQPLANKHYKADLELYFHAWDAGAHPVGALTEKTRVWRGSVGKSAFSHPTVKPLGLMAKIMTNVSARMIVDPFMGSGTTGVAAVRAGKRFVGVETDAEHFETAKKRLADGVLWQAPRTDVKAPGADEPATTGEQEALF